MSRFTGFKSVNKLMQLVTKNIITTSTFCSLKFKPICKDSYILNASADLSLVPDSISVTDQK